MSQEEESFAGRLNGVEAAVRLLDELIGLDAAAEEMEKTYEDRLIAHSQDERTMIDTALVTDVPPEMPYETAIADLRYNAGQCWIPVAYSATPEEAQKTHEQWVRIMQETPPEILLDVCAGRTALLKDNYQGKSWREHRRMA